MPTLTGAEKKFLRGLAHGLKPIVRIGKNGLTEAVIAQLDEAFESHELVKVKLGDLGGDSKTSKREVSREIDARLGSVQVGAIGHVAIFYRQATDPERRSIRLPR